MMVVTIVTIAMVVVLSVLNGMEGIIRSLYTSFDPELQLSAKVGKSFVVNDSLRSIILKTPGVAVLTEVIEDNAIVAYKEEKDVVKIKGVSSNFIAHKRMDSVLIGGKLELENNGVYSAIIGAGIYYKLSVSLNDPFSALTFYYPNKKKIRKPDSPDAFTIASIKAGGVFAIEKQYDDHYIFVPLDFAKELLSYGDKRTSLEIKTSNDYSIKQVQQALKTSLGDSFLVQNSDEQHLSVLRAIHIEKLVVYIILTMLLAVSSVGIYFCLTMLTIRKRKDIAVLKSLGATRSLILRLFLTEGMMIAYSGAASGLVIGYGLCYLQQTYGFVELGMETSLIKAYPVILLWEDFITTSIIVLTLTFLASYLPALKASKLEIHENLY